MKNFVSSRCSTSGNSFGLNQRVSLVVAAALAVVGGLGVRRCFGRSAPIINSFTHAWARRTPRRSSATSSRKTSRTRSRRAAPPCCTGAVRTMVVQAHMDLAARAFRAATTAWKREDCRQGPVWPQRFCAADELSPRRAGRTRAVRCAIAGRPFRAGDDRAAREPAPSHRAGREIHRVRLRRCRRRPARHRPGQRHPPPRGERRAGSRARPGRRRRQSRALCFPKN